MLLWLVLVLLSGTVLAPWAAAETIRNIAEARWTENGQPVVARSNEVAFDRRPENFTLLAFRVDPAGATQLAVRAPLCGGVPVPGLPSGSGTVGTPVGVAPLSKLRTGETLVFQVTAASANRDQSVADAIGTEVQSDNGDREALTIFETGVDTGVFTGAIHTHGVSSGYTAGDCQLGVQPQRHIRIIVPGTGDAPLLRLELDILADPFGVVFDAEDGLPVNGAVISMVDAATGEAASVFADDGVTPWPSTVTTGQPIIDAAGNVYPMPPGEYRFPLAPLGTYRLKVVPPAPYTAPSGVRPEQLVRLIRPEGGPFIISGASYGEAFRLDSREPVQVDIPVDRPNVAVTLTKTASRLRASPGDAVFYTVVVRNPDNRPKHGVALADTPSDKLRLRPDSIRIDGKADEAGVEIAQDGRRLVIRFEPIPPQGTRTITYAMTVREDATSGQATNRAVATDGRGGEAVAEAVIRIEADTLASRMTIVGRVTLGDCGATGSQPGLSGVRVMMEDGSFTITDRDGRYHFEGIVPGTHVVQAQRQTLPDGARFVDCNRSTRNAGSASAVFAIGQGGSLTVIDFAVVGPGTVATIDTAAAQPVTDMIGAVDEEPSRENVRQADQWLALGNGPPTFLLPALGENPRAPSLVVVVRHAPGQTVQMLVDGRPADPLSYDGSAIAEGGTHAVSVWRGIELDGEETLLTALVDDEAGERIARLDRQVDFVSTPWQARIIPERSTLIADGASSPLVAVQLTDRKGRPVRAGMSGSVSINAPYESALLNEQLQVEQLSSRAPRASNWITQGDDGIALVELAPTMISGPLHLDFSFADREVTRRQTLDGWVMPGDQEWTIIGLAEASAGTKSVADNMQRDAGFDSDLGDNARVALYAKGRVLGRFLLTAAYDSAGDADDRRLFGTIDPEAYYTVFGDRSDRRFDAASREKLYVRVENASFYALYGDLVTGFEQSRLALYQRSATGLKAEGLFGRLHVEAFAAQEESRFRRDVIQGNGLTGPYRFADRDILANSERVAIEVRDRFRPEIVVGRRELTRFEDYSVDLLAGTLRLREPLLSRDVMANPQFVVISYEVLEEGATGRWNAGGRADITLVDGALRLGTSVVSDEGEPGRTTILAGDLRAMIGAGTEIRAELATSRRSAGNADAWLVEAEHHTGALDLLAYVTSIENGYGTGQQDVALVGRRKLGADLRYSVDERLSLIGSAWVDNSLKDETSRRAVRGQVIYRTGSTDLQLAIAQFEDSLSDGITARSTVMEAGATRRLLDNRLEISGISSIALDDTRSIDLPRRHQLRARYAVARWARLIGQYETAQGETLSADMFSGGVEFNLWQGGRITTTVGRQGILESRQRSFAAFGAAQTLQVNGALSLDLTLDGSRGIGSVDVGAIVNPGHPAASGGIVGQDGVLFENFTAATVGAVYRQGLWSASFRGEYRDGQYADRTGASLGVIRQIADGTVLGSGLVWTCAAAPGGARSAIFDGAISFARRPANSPLALLAKLEYRSDDVMQAIAGLAGPIGNTALSITGSGASRRLLGSMSANWQPFSRDRNGLLSRRTAIATFLAIRRQIDGFGEYDLSTFTGLAGIDMRIGVGERVEIGGQITARANFVDHVWRWAAGPQIGFVPAEGVLLVLGYNLGGFHDRDFSSVRSTDQGVYATVRAKIDADSFDFLGLGRR